ncbi:MULTISPECIES: NAD(P)/FAD-dependent oxidoreductase [Streptomyces]|uniref:NAD(P)/FAD-dependent oxidoreductase n=1 Tax=Streptomyces TaxID=1883 RepID=UPI00029AA3F6|nr:MULTISPECIES: FAD-binding oxidoreductase [Streptomyces]MCP9957578.1 FAD-binding oxidoreductase [Streptomyces sudanensis]MCP9986706.1 FAD-binding oxidoreductase [Streptomyces sudanensis]MCQ0001880.1 FAD-binding oxidoreductase [Streptomyces sudanensis]
MDTLVLPAPWPARTPAPARRTAWLRDALAAEPDDGKSPALDGDTRCDVCVVGGGYTGLWTALEILRRAPGTDVVLIDADVCGGGASGANAGYLMPMWARFSSLVAISDHAEARRLGEASQRAVDEILDFVDEHGIDAEYRRGPWLWAASSEAQRGAWNTTLEDLARAGVEPLREVSPDRSRRAVGTPSHHGAVADPHCATLQPAKLVRGMRRVALDQGVRVHEHTPLTALRRENGATLAVTRHGTIRADRVVLAINAWAGRLEELAGHMVTVASDTVLTVPVPDRLDAIGWRDATSVCDARKRLNYYRTTPDGRLVFGKGGVGLAPGNSGAGTMWGRALRPGEVRRQFLRLFPDLRDVPVDTMWTAPVEYGVTSVPFAGWLRSVPGVCYATGYSGDGVGPSRLMAKVLASLVLGTDDEWSGSALARPPAGAIPGEPLRYAGSRTALAALRAVEEREDRGAFVPGPVKRLVSVDPSAFRR